VLPIGVQPPDLTRIALLATLPLLANGMASYLLVPLSIAVGRRPVLLLAAACAWAGGLWAGFSPSLTQHLAARSLQGLGAGAVEALIPLVVQDMVFIHQRNKAMAAIVSSQGVVLIGLGIAAPYVAANYTWRWLYFITSGLGFVAWVLLIGYLPETRWARSKEELSEWPASLHLFA
jgi:MFS family permease